MNSDTSEPWERPFPSHFSVSDSPSSSLQDPLLRKKVFIIFTAFSESIAACHAVPQGKHQVLAR